MHRLFTESNFIKYWIIFIPYYFFPKLREQTTILKQTDNYEHYRPYLAQLFDEVTDEQLKQVFSIAEVQHFFLDGNKWRELMGLGYERTKKALKDMPQEEQFWGK
jgi:hypothetical protein